MGRAALFGEKKFKRPANMLTNRQVEILVYLWTFYEQNDQLPPCEVISAQFKYASANAAYEHLLSIARKGWIERNSLGKWKFTAIARESLTEPMQVAA